MEDLNQNQIEIKWQKKWKDNKVFEPKIDIKKEKFFGTVPYPYANSVLHIGHGRAYTSPDLYTRFQRLKGKNVLFPLGFHISGTPVLAVSDAIKNNDEKQIKLTTSAISEYVGDKKKQKKIIETFKDPYEIAKFFSSTIESSLDSIGISIDWSRQFSTGDKNYQKFIEWQFKKLNDCGILVQGKYPILYSVKDENAVGEDDIKDGDIDKVSISEMTYILFKIENSEEYVVAVTLRPDSIFGATNLYIKPEMDLVKLNVNGKIWIVSKKSQIKIENQFSKVKFIEKIKGEKLLNKKVIIPIIDKIVPIYKMDYPDENFGTGIVYSSPADSPHDYIYLFEIKFPGKSLNEFLDKDPLNLVPITKTLDKKGNEIIYKSKIPAYDKLLKNKIFNVENNSENLEFAKQELYKEAHFGGRMINCSDEFNETPLKNNYAFNKVKQKLLDLNLGGIFYETSRRAITRSGDEVIVANLDGQWFLNYKDEKIKEKAYDLLENMDYKPIKLKNTQKGYLKWVEMRPCARKRGIGTPLQQDKNWIIESLSDSTIYQMFYLVNGIIKKYEIYFESLTLEFFDYIFLEIGKIKKISKNSKISEKIILEIIDQIKYWKAFDFRYTASAHLSNHLSFLIYHYALIFPKKLHPKQICIGGMLIRDGHKISKSKGNGLPLIQIPKKFGADLYRLYIGLAANFDVEMDFKDSDILQLSKKFDKFKFLINSSISKKIKNYSSFSQINKWLISKFYSRVKSYFIDFENMRIREAYVGVLYEFLNDISYHERRTSKNETFEVLRFIIEDYIKIMSPAIPHICEEFWEKLNKKSFISLEKFDTKIENFINLEIEELEEISINIISEISKQKELSINSEVKKVIIIQANKSRFELFDNLKFLLNNTKNFKEILIKLIKKFPDEKKFIQKFVPKTLGNGLSIYLNYNDEKKLFENLSNFIKEEFNLELEIKLIEDEKNNAIPSMPKIILE